VETHKLGNMDVGGSQVRDCRRHALRDVLAACFTLQNAVAVDAVTQQIYYFVLLLFLVEKSCLVCKRSRLLLESEGQHSKIQQSTLQLPSVPTLTDFLLHAGT
jgi:hypothetical protein